MKVKTAVLGAGIAGLAYAGELPKEEVMVFEKNGFRGGLCHSFQVQGFTFDSAVHLSFTGDPEAREQFDKTPYIKHLPVSYNFYDGYWIKHPVVNNMSQLPPEEKVRFIKSFVERDGDRKIDNYRDWLFASYGKEISEAFYEVYTRKYWTVDATELSTTWIGNRLGTPDLEKMLWGSFSSETGTDYYAKEMRYPVQGGYQAFLNNMADNVPVTCNKEAVALDLREKKITFKDGTACSYENLASSIPLPRLAEITVGAPEHIRKLAKQLKASKISLVSVGFNRQDIPRCLWFYIYDRDIMAARVNSPSMKSKNNAPENCSSLQFEIYHAAEEQIDRQKVVENTKEALLKMQLCNEEDILFMDYRLLEYGNVIFEKGMEEKRDEIRNYYVKNAVDLIGRFGEWEYYWSDQSYMSGRQKGILRRAQGK